MAFSIQGATFLLSTFASFEASKKVEITSSFLVFLDLLRICPFLLKPLYGFISDVFPLFGYRFKSFMIGGLFVQLMICLFLYFYEDPSLITLYSLDLMLNITCAFVGSLAEGIITIDTKIDSKICYPDFLENQNKYVFESQSNRFIGVYQFLFLCGNYLFSYVSYLISSHKILSQKKIFLMYGTLTFVFGMMTLFYFKEKKVRKKINFLPFFDFFQI